MNSQKKLGTFGGVFTPSILTILGVIMDMRLPWIVGIIVYIRLVVFFSLTVQPEQMVNNTKVLMDISLFPQAGGSSYLEGDDILGHRKHSDGPIILQATSIDLYCPPIFR